MKGRLISVLIVDADDAFRARLADACKQSGLSVIQGSDGNSAWKSFLHHSFDAVVTELHMPHGNGIHLLKHIKAISPATPVFIVTGDLRGYSGEPTLKLAEKILHKPFDPIELAQTVLERCSLTVGQKKS